MGKRGPQPTPNEELSGEQYVKDTSRRAEYQRAISENARDIGQLPDVVNPGRKDYCRTSFQSFCELYHPDLFHRAWSDDHIKCLGKLEAAILRGDQYAFAMPRGSGKTTLCYIACEWALIYGHRSFVVMVGAEATASLELLDSIRTDMENNELLAEDFPEVIFPIIKLGGISHRCNGQTYLGNRTQMTWTSDRIVFPTIEGSPASGATVRVTGITGRLRGMQSKTPDGKSIRPDLVIIDDPQTDDSARSVTQNDYREKLLAGAILGLAGPGESIAAMMPCTVIRNGDMADRILDRQRHPEWRGERTKLIYEWPKATKLWEEYAEVWTGELRNDGDGSVAAAFYAERQEEMDEGAKVGWPARFLEGEISALQHAWNLRLRIGDEAFNAEYQNEPDDLTGMTDRITVTSDYLTARVSKVGRGIVPVEYDHLVAFVDISQKCLWWTLVAVGEGFGGTVVDYGTWPDQGQRYIRLSSVKRTLLRKYRGQGVHAAITHGLGDLIAYLMREWDRETGGSLQCDRILIDEGDGEHTELVRSFCRRSDHGAILMPAKGRGIKASSVPLCYGKSKKNERYGKYWKMVRNRDQSRSVHMDVNYWKTFVMRRFEMMTGQSGAIDLYKNTPRHHQMFADQLTAEIPKEIEDIGTGNRVIEWTNPRQRDNHFFDCMVGCCVAASMLGITLVSEVPIEPARRKRKKVTYL